MTNLETIAANAAVASLSVWKDRHYINFANKSASSNGDRNLKVWIKGDVITMEPYKGYLSDDCKADLYTIEALADELGMTFVRK